MKYAMVGLTLLLIVASAGAGTLTDNFDDGNFDGWWRMEVGNIEPEWLVRDGVLVYTSENVCNVAHMLGIGDNTWTEKRVGSLIGQDISVKMEVY